MERVSGREKDGKNESESGRKSKKGKNEVAQT